MGEKGNVADAASGLVDRGADLAQGGVDVAAGVVVGGATGAVSGVMKDRVEEKMKTDDKDPERP